MPQPFIRKALLATSVVGLTVAAGVAVFVAAERQQKRDQVTTVVLDGKTCQPANLTVPAGRNTFLIKNVGPRTIEWEILKGVMVIEERENIRAGQSQTMTVTLEPGTYEITCSPRSKFVADLRGKLEVIAAPGGAPTKPTPAEMIGALAEYRFYVFEEVSELMDKTTAFVEAVKAGDVAQAKALYAPARVHYERIEPVAELFSDLDGAIDSRADDHEKAEADPTFTGFHRLEHALWVDGSTKDMEAVADKLLTDVAELQSRVRSLDIPAGKMAGGAALLLEEVAATKISGEEERYSRTDLWDFAANLQGAGKVVDLLRPMLVKLDAPLVDRIDTNMAAVKAVLDRYATPDGGFQTYDKLTDADRAALQGPVTTLAEDLSRLRGTLGLD